ncbi:hypothetical protein DYB36_013611 [Aphanomyces astaci]|uniref:F-box domain-containing protein n=1 Tax=Aphanomyces astaci TaxID=112090 RepID=A0A397AXB6_APHAT|nr:hypothetical protein DYB36_013611 [Aphanomyces astaci]
MVDAEWRLRHLAVTSPSPPEIQAVNDLFPTEDATRLDDDEDADDVSAVEESIVLPAVGGILHDNDANGVVPVCNLPERMLQAVLEFLDEDSIGFYVLRLSYYKKPEWNMWSDLPKDAVLQAIYYRYFCFQRNGTVLYAMTHRHPREVRPAMT